MIALHVGAGSGDTQQEQNSNTRDLLLQANAMFLFLFFSFQQWQGIKSQLYGENGNFYKRGETMQLGFSCAELCDVLLNSFALFLYINAVNLNWLIKLG